MVSLFSIVLVGLREWENPSKNCDIMNIYDDLQIEQIKQNPRIKIDRLLQRRMENSFNGSSTTSELEFTNDIDEDDDDLLMPKHLNKKKDDEPLEEFILEKTDEIDIDDI
jgi:hypothetical protein